MVVRQEGVPERCELRVWAAHRPWAERNATCARPPAGVHDRELGFVLPFAWCECAYARQERFTTRSCHLAEQGEFTGVLDVAQGPQHARRRQHVGCPE